MADSMLSDDVMLKISLIISMVGLLFLFLIFIFNPPEEKKIDEIENEDIGSNILLKGKISKIYSNDNRTSIRLVQECEISLISFERINTTMLKENSSVSVEGKLEEFNGKKNVIIKKITLK